MRYNSGMTNQANTALLCLPSGRLFLRNQGIVGLVEMPLAMSTECMRQMRCDTHLWVDDLNHRPAATRYGDSNVGTHSANDILTSTDFGQMPNNDGLECFVRRSFLPHADPTMAWNIVLSAKREPLTGMADDGLYEFNNGQCHFISAETYIGNNLGQVLQQPIWGPSGQFALTSSMEPNAYQGWIGPERERAMAKDPVFKAFVHTMQALGDLPMYMTKAQLDAREMHSISAIQTALQSPDSGL